MSAALALVLAAGAVALVSGLPLLAPARFARGARRSAAALAVAAAGLGLAGVLLAWLAGEARAAHAWTVPGGSLALRLDGLAALFLAPLFVVFGSAAVYGLAYWQPAAPAPGRRLPVFLGLLAGGMVLLLLAGNGVLFLVGWETMALAAFFLIATEHHQAPARKAAWTYLVATHAGTGALFAAFALLPAPGGSLDWEPAAIATLPAGQSGAVFALALVGFGLKAGVMPLHVWLPAAHAKAPSHVSALLSGVMLKMGVYGVVRMAAMLPPQPFACGALVLALGLASALLAAAACLGQGDLKRLLAYSSIENVGIVFIGVGLWLLGRASGEGAWMVLGLGGALLHVLNHGLFKPLLFLCAGSVIHATGTRRIAALGGLARGLPRTAAGFLVGAVAICGLPGLNGFVGEAVLYFGLFHLATATAAVPSLLGGLGVAVLALTGALALAAFVRAFGAVFLGHPRSAAARAAHEAPAAMTGPMALLAALCLLAGLLPFAVAPIVDRAVAAAVPGGAARGLNELAPLRAFAAAALATALLIVVGHLLLRRRAAGDAIAHAGTWDCGYADPSSPRLQYTASSFAQFLLRLLAWAVPRRLQAPPPMELFPAPARFQQSMRETLLQGVLLPFCQRWADRCARLRILQQGNVHLYLLYILVVLLVLLGWSVVDAWLAP